MTKFFDSNSLANNWQRRPNKKSRFKKKPWYNIMKYDRRSVLKRNNRRYAISKTSFDNLFKNITFSWIFFHKSLLSISSSNVNFFSHGKNYAYNFSFLSSNYNFLKFFSSLALPAFLLSFTNLNLVSAKYHKLFVFISKKNILGWFLFLRLVHLNSFLQTTNFDFETSFSKIFLASLNDQRQKYYRLFFSPQLNNYWTIFLNKESSVFSYLPQKLHLFSLNFLFRWNSLKGSSKKVWMSLANAYCLFYFYKKDIVIFDAAQTLSAFKKAFHFLIASVQNGAQVLFICWRFSDNFKDYFYNSIKQCSQSGSYGWTGGLLTNIKKLGLFSNTYIKNSSFSQSFNHQWLKLPNLFFNDSTLLSHGTGPFVYKSSNFKFVENADSFYDSLIFNLLEEDTFSIFIKKKRFFKNLQEGLDLYFQPEFSIKNSVFTSFSTIINLFTSVFFFCYNFFSKYSFTNIFTIFKLFSKKMFILFNTIFIWFFFNKIENYFLLLNQHTAFTFQRKKWRSIFSMKKSFPILLKNKNFRVVPNLVTSMKNLFYSNSKKKKLVKKSLLLKKLNSRNKVKRNNRLGKKTKNINFIPIKRLSFSKINKTSVKLKKSFNKNFIFTKTALRIRALKRFRPLYYSKLHKNILHNLSFSFDNRSLLKNYTLSLVSPLKIFFNYKKVYKRRKRYFRKRYWPYYFYHAKSFFSFFKKNIKLWRRRKLKRKVKRWKMLKFKTFKSRYLKLARSFKRSFKRLFPTIAIVLNSSNLSMAQSDVTNLKMPAVGILNSSNSNGYFTYPVPANDDDEVATFFHLNIFRSSILKGFFFRKKMFFNNL